VKDRILVGLIGHPVSHSLTPRLIGAAFGYCQMDGEYNLYDVEEADLPEKVKSLIEAGLHGFNITIPHKSAVLPLVHELAPEAQLIGAINTVQIKPNQLVGYNTDAIGFRRALESLAKRDLKNSSALILGTGGSAQAVLVALIQLGFSEIHVSGRTEEKSKAFIQAAQKRMLDHLELPISSSPVRIVPYQSNHGGQLDLIVNSIPFGVSAAAESITPPVEAIISSLSSTCLAVDLAYRRDQTLPPFAKATSERELLTQDGIEMLVQNASACFEIWTGRKVPPEVIKSALAQEQVK
jgi:shikimate dehydrogenase